MCKDDAFKWHQHIFRAEHYIISSELLEKWLYTFYIQLPFSLAVVWIAIPQAQLQSVLCLRTLLSLRLFHHPPVVSHLDSQSRSGISCSTPTVNPLVWFLLNLQIYLTLLLWTKEPTKCITGARDLTANEYYEWLNERRMKPLKQRKGGFKECKQKKEET